MSALEDLAQSPSSVLCFDNSTRAARSKDDAATSKTAERPAAQNVDADAVLAAYGKRWGDPEPSSDAPETQFRLSASTDSFSETGGYALPSETPRDFEPAPAATHGFSQDWAARPAAAPHVQSLDASPDRQTRGLPVEFANAWDDRKRTAAKVPALVAEEDEDEDDEDEVADLCREFKNDWGKNRR